MNVTDLVHQLEGKVMNTLYRNKPFRVVAVDAESVRVVPIMGNGAERKIRVDRITELFEKNLGWEELRCQAQKLFRDSRNTSYMAAIVHAISCSQAPLGNARPRSSASRISGPGRV